jgi:hypothetical protein
LISEPIVSIVVEFNYKHRNAAPLEMARTMFERHGYQLPAVIWWNIAHRAGGFGGDKNYPVSADQSGTALISGFSPSIVRSVLSAQTVTPMGVMLQTINHERYAAVEHALSGGAA